MPCLLFVIPLIEPIHFIITVHAYYAHFSWVNLLLQFCFIIKLRLKISIVYFGSDFNFTIFMIKIIFYLTALFTWGGGSGVLSSKKTSPTYFVIKFGLHFLVIVKNDKDINGLFQLQANWFLLKIWANEFKIICLISGFSFLVSGRSKMTSHLIYRITLILIWIILSG